MNKCSKLFIPACLTCNDVSTTSYAPVGFPLSLKGLHKSKSSSEDTSGVPVSLFTSEVKAEKTSDFTDATDAVGAVVTKTVVLCVLIKR